MIINPHTQTQVELSMDCENSGRMTISNPFVTCQQPIVLRRLKNEDKIFVDSFHINDRLSILLT